MQLTQAQEKLSRIFHPNYHEAVQRLANPQNPVTCFVHYTGAKAAISILENKAVWMRNAAHMNDYTEVRHGLDCLIHAYNMSEAGKAFRQVLENAFPGICSKIEVAFNQRIPALVSHTYLACISEHYNTENEFGRLSMWRAYGETTQVALVLNASGIINAPDPVVGLVSSNVAYLNKMETEKEFGRITDNIAANIDFIRTQGEDEIMRWVFYMLVLAALCTKHKGFEEEREWRVVYNPELFGQSDEVKKAIVSINGDLQKVYQIPLTDIPASLNKVIIGPTQYADALKEKFIEILGKANVENPERKIIVSDIPLRHK